MANKGLNERNDPLCTKSNLQRPKGVDTHNNQDPPIFVSGLWLTNDLTDAK